MKRSTDSMARTGVHAVGLIFTDKFGWTFREQHESDFGVDAQVEVIEAGKATGKLVALQIKAGSSHLREKGSGYVYQGELRHLDYWLNHSLPVFLIFHDPDKNLTLFRRVEKAAVKRTDKGWSIEVPKTNVLDERAKAEFEKVRELTEEEQRRERLADDASLIRAIAKAAVAQATVRVAGNEDTGVTDIRIVCNDENGKRVSSASTWFGGSGGHYTAHDAMQQEYWFLDYHYAENVDRGDDYEDHKFDVHVKPDVLGYLEVEKILKEGPPETVEPKPDDIPYDDPPFEEEFREALRGDWEEERWSREKD
jgi:hypothetical protein